MGSPGEPAKRANKPTNTLTALFWATVAAFFSIGVTMAVLYLVLAFREYGRFVFPSILAVFLLLSVALLVIAAREKVEGLFKKLLIITGASALGSAVGIFLENFLTGTAGEYIFFIIGVIICPIGFLVGMVGSIVLFIKRRRIAQ